jgi:hypothetical protein
VRAGFFAFDLPATFAQFRSLQGDPGLALAVRFKEELQRRGVLSAAEIIPEKPWPGKREDFLTGNFQAIQIARQAGFDLLFLGFVEDLRSKDELSLTTKAIDLRTQATIWYARTTLVSPPTLGAVLGQEVGVTNPFATERMEGAVVCAVDQMMRGVEVPGERAPVEAGRLTSSMNYQ